MLTDNYHVIAWYEDLWPDAEPSNRYMNAMGYIQTAIDDGYKPIGIPTPIYYVQDEGMRVYLTQVFYKEPSLDTITSDKLEPENSFLNYTIDEMELTKRTSNFLKMVEIGTVRDLMNYSEKELSKIPNLGKRSLTEIKDVLFIWDLKLPHETIKEVEWWQNK